MKHKPKTQGSLLFGFAEIEGVLPTVWGDVNVVDRGDRRRQRLSTKLTEGYSLKANI